MKNKKREHLSVGRALMGIGVVLLLGAASLFAYNPVSYTHLTLPTTTRV